MCVCIIFHQLEWGMEFLRDIDYLFICFASFLFLLQTMMIRQLTLLAMCEEVARIAVYYNNIFFVPACWNCGLARLVKSRDILEDDDVNVENYDEDDKTRNENAVHSTRS